MKGQFRTAGRVAFMALAFLAFILLWMGALHFIIGGDKPFAEVATTVFFGFAVLGAIGLGGWGIQVLGDRLFGLPVGTTARYVAIGLIVVFVLYGLAHPGLYSGSVEF